jgi:hypothetical protein
MQEFLLRKYISEDYASVRKLIYDVWQETPVKDWFAVDDFDYLDKILGDLHTCIIEAVDTATNRQAAVFVLVFPASGPDNLGADIGLDEDEQRKVVHMDIAATLPEFRGHGLQYRLMDYAEKMLQTTGIKYLMCTVHPENVFSKRNVEKLGYRLVKTGMKYGGLPRCTYLKKIN